MTSRAAHAIADVSEDLMHEFEGFLPVSTITGTVLRVARDGRVPSAELAARARGELVSLVGGDPTEPVSGRAGASQSRGER